MPNSYTPRIAVAGRAPYMAMVPSVRRVLAQQSLDIDFEELAVAEPSFGYLVDTLEYMPKTGVLAVDIWHPALQEFASVTQQSDSASEAGSVDFIAFRDSDFGVPFGYNVSFSAAERILREHGSRIHGASALIVGDLVPARGVRAALLQKGVKMVEVVEVEASDAVDLEHNLASPLGPADLFFDLLLDSTEGPSDELSGRMLPGFVERWHAERMRLVVELSTSRKLSPDAFLDMAAVFAYRADRTH